MTERAVETLERAFVDDPMFRWLFPDPARRARAVRTLNRVPLEYGLRYGQVDASHDGLAVAVWIPPGRNVSMTRMIRCGLAGVPVRTGLRPFIRFMRANAAIGTLHSEFVPEPHWYLLVVAVHPDLQGRGIGSALVREGLARADASYSPCYLETSDKRNIPFYERLGFVVKGSCALGSNGPPGWAMRRDPRT